MHKNCANRIIALKGGELEKDFRSFPQGFPLLCAKLNAREIFLLRKGRSRASGKAKLFLRQILTARIGGC
jgi:hypothetical protein